MPPAGEKLKQLEQQLERETTLRKLSDRIHSSSLDEIILKVRADIQTVLGGERVTIYAVEPGKNEIFSKVKDGEEIREIRIPISPASIAGFVAQSRKVIRLKDAYDTDALAAVHPDLRFDASWDKKTGFRKRQVLCAPLVKDDRLLGALQVVNRKTAAPFSAEDEATLVELSQTLAIAFSNQRKIHLRRSKYDSLLVSETLTEEQLEQAQREALAGEESVERVLMKKFKIAESQLADSFQQHFRCDFVGYDEALPPPEELLEKLDPDYLKFHLVVPLGLEGENVLVLMDNPKDIQKISDLATRLKVPERRIRQRCGIKEDILRYIDRFYGTGKKPEEEAQQAVAATTGNEIFSMLEAENLASAAATGAAADADD
jgi:hypothetical protein